jgi:hypothetical protein
MNTGSPFTVRTHLENQLMEFSSKYNLEDDSELFWCVNTRHIEAARFPHLVTGQMLKEKIKDGYYDFKYAHPNPSPLVQRLAQESAQKAQEAQQLAKAAQEAVAAKVAAEGDVTVPPQTVELRQPKPKRGVVID